MITNIFGEVDINYIENGANKYFDVVFIHKSNANQRWMYRLYFNIARMSLYYTSDGGSTWSTAWDKTLA